MKTNRVLQLQVVADLVCPWCYIGKRSLDRAVEVVAAQGLHVEIEWLPYQLNPAMPLEGMDRQEFRTRRFGWNESLAMDARAIEAGRRAGADFRYDLQPRTPNTLAAHALVRQAHAEGGAELQGRLVEALFEAYFTLGQDIGNDGVLARVAEAVGMKAGANERSRVGRADVLEVEASLRRLGVNSVPSYFMDGSLVSRGSNTVDGYVRLLDEAANLPA